MAAAMMRVRRDQAHDGGHADPPAAQRANRTLLLYEDDCGGRHAFQLHAQVQLTIGRGEDADLRLAWDPSVSLLHARLIPLGSHWLIADEGLSRNGTFVNGERLSGRRRLRDRDVVRIGAVRLAFHDAGTARRDTTTIADSLGASGTVTLLFSDLVGSTALLERLGEARGERVRREHMALLRAQSSEHGGKEIKNLGDGLMVAFASALSAAACATSMQRQIAARAARGEESMSLRIGLNVGEVTSAEGDYFGSPVVLAARLCDRAEGGQTLVSRVLRSLIGEREEHRFRALGALALKGFSEPQEVFALEWRPQRSRNGSSA